MRDIIPHFNRTMLSCMAIVHYIRQKHWLDVQQDTGDCRIRGWEGLQRADLKGNATAAGYF